MKAAYQNAVYKSSAYREPTDKLVNKINVSYNDAWCAIARTFEMSFILNSTAIRLLLKL